MNSAGKVPHAPRAAIMMGLGLDNQLTGHPGFGDYNITPGG
jgi:hypothetical protein